MTQTQNHRTIASGKPPPCEPRRGEFPAQPFRARLGLLTQDELAAVLDVSPETLREWRRIKQGPDYVKAGKTVMYREKDVIRWIERNIVPIVP